MKLFQNIVIPGYIEGLDYNSHIPICTSVGPLLRKIIQQHVFFKHIPKPGWYPRVFLEGMEYFGTPAKAIMSGRGGVPKYTYVKIGVSGGGQNN